MSKRSFNEIEQAIKAAAEAHEPAFDEQAWKKMEALLDKEKDRKRPFVFWLWWLLPLITGAGVLSYLGFKNSDRGSEQQKITAQKNVEKAPGNVGDNIASLPETLSTPDDGKGEVNNNTETVIPQNEKEKKHNLPAVYNNNELKPRPAKENLQPEEEVVNSKTNLKEKTSGKMIVGIKAPMPANENENTGSVVNTANADDNKSTEVDLKKADDIVVIKVDADKVTEKQLEKMADSVVEKISSDKKPKNKIARLYIIASGGVENSGVKLFSSGKITGRYGLEAGYQINKKISVQAGFYISNKKYGAAGSDYKAKPGSYWNMVDIKSINANCKVYEIPLSVVYNFTTGKRINLFAAAGLSSYIMKKEDYYFYYERYGTAHQADAYYTGNKNLFSVLRLSAGIEKKLSKNFSIMASPGVSLPLSGVGEGEVKLYSADIMIGLKFTPSRKK